MAFNAGCQLPYCIIQSIISLIAAIIYLCFYISQNSTGNQYQIKQKWIENNKYSIDDNFDQNTSIGSLQLFNAQFKCNDSDDQLFETRNYENSYEQCYNDCTTDSNNRQRCTQRCETRWDSAGSTTHDCGTPTMINDDQSTPISLQWQIIKADIPYESNTVYITSSQRYTQQRYMAEKSKWTGVGELNHKNDKYEFIAVDTSDFDTYFLQDGQLSLDQLMSANEQDQLDYKKWANQMKWGLIISISLLIVGILVIFRINICCCCCKFKKRKKYKNQESELVSKLSNHSKKRDESSSSKSKKSKSKKSESDSSKSKSNSSKKKSKKKIDKKSSSS